MTFTLDNALFLSRDDCLIAITQCLLRSWNNRTLTDSNIISLSCFMFSAGYFTSDDPTSNQMMSFK